MKKKIYGWHFVGATLRDGSPVPPDGEWLEYKGELKMCISGLHFSDTPAQALEHAPGAILCYVELENIVQCDNDKGVCSRRKIIARMDATEACQYTARMNALSVSHLWADSDDPGDVVLDWLLTGDESIRVSALESALESALDSARASDWAKARASASAWESARARALASDSVRESARESAIASAWAKARASASAWASAKASARARFNELIYECFEDVLP